MIKNKITTFAGTWLEVEAIILSKLTQTENQVPHVVTHEWELYENTHRGEQHTLEPFGG